MNGPERGRRVILRRRRTTILTRVILRMRLRIPPGEPRLRPRGPRAALAITSVFSQRTYPSGRPGGLTESQARDVDDCWCVSIFQCVDASCPACPLPTIRAFRHAAGDPDDDKRDGAGSDFREFRAGIPKAWPQLAGEVRYLQDRPWSEFEPLLREGWIASVAVTSSLLPAPLGFAGAHQVTVFAAGNQPFIANPLQAEGSRPTPISWDRLRRSMTDYGGGEIYAVMFPPRRAAPAGTAQTTAHTDEGGEMPIEATFRAGSGRATAARPGNAFDYVTRKPRHFDSGYVRNVVALATLEVQLSPSLKKGELMLVTTFGEPDRLELIRAKDTDWPAGQSALEAPAVGDCSAVVQRELEAAAQRAAAAIRAQS